MIKRIIIFLLLIYPVIALLPRDSVLPNTIWGLTTTMFILFAYIQRLTGNQSGFLKNTFDKIGFYLFIIISISILLSGDLNFNKWYSMLKIILPVMIASFIFLEFDFNEKTIKKIYNISLAYLFVFILFILYRLSLISYNLFSVMANRETIWYDKPYGVAITYSTLVLLFFYTAFKLKKLSLWHFVFFLPGYFFGSRTVLIGITLFMLYIILLKFRGVFGYVVLFFVLVFSVIYLNFNSQLQSDVGSGVTKMLLSERDAQNETNEITQSSFTSGRDNIFYFYWDNLTPLKVFTGTGFEYLNEDTDFGFRLHNDILEFFFSFGVFGFLIFLYFVYGKLLLRTIFINYGDERIYFIGFMLFFVALSVLSSIMDYQNIIYLYLVLIINYKLKALNI